MLDSRRLRVLAELERRGSIAATARSLSFVPSAISQQINSLERELGIALTERVDRRITLTPAGRLLAKHAKPIFRQLARAEEAVRQLDSRLPQRLRLSACPDVSAELLAAGLAAMGKADPDCELSVLHQPAEEALAAVWRHESDVAVVCRAEGASPDRSELAERVLLCDRLMLIVADDHPATLNGEIELASLAGERWVLGSSGSLGHALTLAACRGAGFEPVGAYRTDDATFALRLVAAGLGVAVMPWSAVGGSGARVVALPIRDAPVRLTIAAWPEDDRTEAVGAMVECLRSQAIGSEG